jgi:RNA polymerase sigma factor (sigma-70 family)
MGMVFSLAHRYSFLLKNSYGDFKDLVDEGVIAVMKNLPRWHSEIGSFYNYAHDAVKGAMLTYLSKTRKGFGRPMYYCNEINQIKYAIIEIRKQKGKSYTPDAIEIEKMTGIRNVAKKLSLDSKVLSLQEPLYKSNDMEERVLMDTIRDNHDQINQDNYILREELIKALNKLKPKERKVIEMRYDLTGCEYNHTMEECGKILGLTRQGIQQIEMKAFRKLRRNKLLKDFLKQERVVMQ